MTIESPHLGEKLPATRDSISRTIRLLSSKSQDPFAILSESDSITYMQTLFTPEGFSLDFQDGSLTEHYRTVRSDLTVDDIIEAFCDYAEGNSSWRHRFDFVKIELRPFSERCGFAIGRIAGRVVRFVRGG
jgi:hypothetical protein